MKLLHQIVMSQSVTTKILRETQSNVGMWANFYWRIAFDQTPGEVSDVLFNLYLNDETKLSSKAEDIFAQAIDFFSNLLIEMEQAGFNFDNPGEVLDSSEAIDEFIRVKIFTQDQVIKMMTFILQRFLVLTHQELLLLDEDQLKFYNEQKNQSSETKGNFLRDKATSFVASLQSSFKQQTVSFFSQLINDVKAEAYSGEGIEWQTKKDALYQLLLVKLADQDTQFGKEVFGIVSLDLERGDQFYIV